MRRLATLRRLAFGTALAGLALFYVTAGALAQDRDVRPLVDRLDRLERDMNMLQRQVYRGTGPTGAPVAVSPPDAQSALNTEVRISQIEDQMRTVTGQIEESNYNIDQMKRRLDKLVSDIDLRLSTLEHGGTSATAGGGAAQPLGSDVPPSRSAPRGLAGQPSPPGGAGADPGAPPSRSGVLGTLPTSRGGQGGAPEGGIVPPSGDGSAPAVVTNTAAAGAAGTLPSGTPSEQYNYAFGLLRQTNYPAAEQAFRTFLQRYPNDAMSGNAEYWLGETYYVRNDFNNAAAVFAEGYQKYPKSGKAADFLLKLSMSLGNLGQKADACRALTRLDRDFPAAASPVKDRANSEKQRLGC
jgi:tol-pal system protein YbgF